MHAPADPTTPAALVAHWLTSLELERHSDTEFISPAGPAGQRRWGAALMAQALVAAARTSTLRIAVSLNTQFIRPASMGEPVTYDVEILSDGRRLARRLVRALQGGKVAAVCAISLGDAPGGPAGPFGHGLPMPEAPAPETLGDWWAPLVQRLNLTPQPNPWDLRSVGLEHADRRNGELPWRRTWARPLAPLPDDPLVHAAAILAVSDRAFTATTGLAYGKPAMTSLDHSVWWHAPPRFDDWLLFSSESPNGTASRTLTTGAFHTPDGRHAVSVAQEAMSLSGLGHRAPA